MTCHWEFKQVSFTLSKTNKAEKNGRFWKRSIHFGALGLFSRASAVSFREGRWKLLVCFFMGIQGYPGYPPNASPHGNETLWRIG